MYHCLTLPDIAPPENEFETGCTKGNIPKSIEFFSSAPLPSWFGSTFQIFIKKPHFPPLNELLGVFIRFLYLPPSLKHFKTNWPNFSVDTVLFFNDSQPLPTDRIRYSHYNPEKCRAKPIVTLFTHLLWFLSQSKSWAPEILLLHFSLLLSLLLCLSCKGIILPISLITAQDFWNPELEYPFHCSLRHGWILEFTVTSSSLLAV